MAAPHSDYGEGKSREEEEIASRRILGIVTLATIAAAVVAIVLLAIGLLT